VLSVVVLTFLGAFFTCSGTGLSEDMVVVRVSSHEPGVEGGEIGYVPTQSGTPGHLLVPDTFVCAPL
jgi:hypothetical protein